MKLTTCFTAISLILVGLGLSNPDTASDCEKKCTSCGNSNACSSTETATGSSATYDTDNQKSEDSDKEDEECKVTVTNSTEDNGSGGGAGITAGNYDWKNLVIDGVGPDYVKYEYEEVTEGGVTTNEKKSMQLPTRDHTVFYTDLADGSGYQAAQYLKSDLSKPDANGLRTIPAGAEPVGIIIYRNPDGLADTTQGNLETINKQRHPQTGAWITRTVLRHAPQGDNEWTIKFYLGDPAQNTTLQPYREITINRTPHQDGTESTREVTKDRDNSGTLVITSDISATYAFYKYGSPVKLSETRHTGTGSSVTTDYTYYSDAGEQASFNKPATMRRSDGRWANYSYQGSRVTGITVTKTVSGWLDNPAPAVGTAADESINRVVTVVEAENETGTFSREEKIAGVIVSRTWGERYVDNSKFIVEKTRVETGSTTLVKVETAYPNNATHSKANRGRMKSVQHPDGTLTLYSYAMNGDNLVETMDNGIGTLEAGIADGTRTVSTYTETDTLIEEKVTDIASGVILSSRIAIAFDANEQPSRWAYDSNPEDYSETLRGCCGIDSTRSRSGVTTTYTRDGLKRPKTAVSQGITTTYTYGSTDINGTTFPSTNVTRTAGGLTIDQGTTVYDHAGNVIQTIAPDRDGDGNAELTSVSRNYSTRITTTTNPDGGTVIVENHADGQTKSTTGTATTASYYAYGTHTEQGGGRLTSMAPTVSGPWSRSYYNLAGRTLKTTYDDGSELVLQNYGYDSVGRSVSMTDADGVTTLTAYNTKGEAYQQAVDLNQNGQIDSADRITETQRDVISDSPIGDAIRTRSIIYDLSGNAVTTSTSYRSPDGLTTRQESLGVSSPSTSDSASHTDRADGSWVDTSTAPDGSKTTVTYQNWLPVTRSIIDASGSVITSSTTGYDALRRSVTQTDSRTEASVVTRTDYHTSNGLVIAVKDITPDDSDPNTDPITIRTTSFAYDAMGRRISTTLPDTSTTHTSYTLRGETLATWGSQTYARLYQYDARGRMIELRTFQDLAHGTQPTTATTGYASTTWSYNGRNHLIRKEYDDDNGTNYTYTSAGRLKTRQWARGNWTRYDYDVAGALSATLYFTAATTESAVLAAAAGNDPLTPDVIVSNDKLGRPSTVTQTNQSTLSYVYDQSTLLLDKETIGYDTDADGTVDFSRTLDRSVDGFRRSTGWELKNGTTVEHSNTYDYRIHDSRLNTVTGHSQSHTYGYEPGSYGLVKTVTSPAHTVTNKYEHTRNVLEQKKNAFPSVTTPVSQFDYSVNNIRQRENLTTTGSAFSTAPAYTWTYNAAGELIQADDTSTANNDRSYSYDKIGNRITAGSTNYTADKLNQYTAIGTLSPAYDADGNMISGPLPSYLSANSILVWDGENRLVSVTVNSVTTNYEYDAQGRRISKQVDTDPAIYYLYDGWNMIAEYTGTTLNKSYTWGMDLSGSMQGAGGVGGLLAVNDGTASYYPTYDGNGNVSEYLDSAGATVAHYEYDAFGNTIVSTGSKVADFAHRFSTKPHDAETGLYYYGYRYYDPVTGRWPSRDPIEERGGYNLYGFVGNRPIGLIDRLGRDPFDPNIGGPVDPGGGDEDFGDDGWGGGGPVNPGGQPPNANVWFEFTALVDVDFKADLLCICMCRLGLDKDPKCEEALDIFKASGLTAGFTFTATVTHPLAHKAKEDALNNARASVPIFKCYKFDKAKANDNDIPRQVPAPPVRPPNGGGVI